MALVLGNFPQLQLFGTYFSMHFAAHIAQFYDLFSECFTKSIKLIRSIGGELEIAPEAQSRFGSVMKFDVLPLLGKFDCSIHLSLLNL
jgi:hypothetical protein